MFMIQPICTPFTLNSLPYLSQKNLENHYAKYLKYIEKVNKNPILHKYKSLIDLLINYKTADNLLKNAAQIYSHEVFWYSLSTKYSNPINYAPKKFWSNLIGDCLNHFDSGWCWIFNNKNSLNYKITNSWEFVLPKSDNKIFFNIDLWEHSYYCDYGLNYQLYLQNIIYHLRW